MMKKPLSDLAVAAERALRTHDLIDCSCAGVPCDRSIDSPKQVVDEEEPFWKPESREVSEDEEDLPEISAIVRASQLPTEYPENENGMTSPAKKVRKQSGKKEGDAQAEELMRYLHIDTSKVSNLEDEALGQVEEVIRDECLMRVLQQSEEQIAGSVAWVFKKATGSGTVSAQADAVAVKQEKLTCDFFT